MTMLSCMCQIKASSSCTPIHYLHVHVSVHRYQVTLVLHPPFQLHHHRFPCQTVQERLRIQWQTLKMNKYRNVCVYPVWLKHLTRLVRKRNWVLYADWSNCLIGKLLINHNVGGGDCRKQVGGKKLPS